MSKLVEKILFVDDDKNVLTGYQRQLRKKVNIYTATSAAEGLSLITSKGPFAVVVSDMRMPHMNGAQFLTKVKELDPDVVRIILTGQADIDSAVEAINNGQIFRFLTKPCPPQSMAEALLSGIKQYRLLNAEREILQETLTGSIKVLTELLSLSNPVVFGQATQIKRYVRHLIDALKIENYWDIEMAAMLSRIGHITLPEHTLRAVASGNCLNEEEYNQLQRSTQISVKLLNNIPRLNTVIKIIESQNAPFKLQKPVFALEEDERIQLGAHLLKASKYFAAKINCNNSVETTIDDMKRQGQEFDPAVVEHFKNISLTESQNTQILNISQLSTGMIIEDDVRHNNGMLLLSKGHEVTDAVLVRLDQYSRNDAIRQPIRVSVKSLSL